VSHYDPARSSSRGKVAHKVPVRTKTQIRTAQSQYQRRRLLASRSEYETSETREDY
jgi:hypothetical protein